MIRRPPRSTRTDTLFPYTTLCRSRGTIPGHDGAGPLHMEFRITADSYDIWRAHLTAAGVTMRAEVAWPAGGHSLYFEVPDRNVLEQPTPGNWPIYGPARTARGISRRPTHQPAPIPVGDHAVKQGKERE